MRNTRIRDIHGFTSVELLVVIVVLSLLAGSIIVKNPFAVEDYSGMASDQLIADIRMTQLKALGTRRPQSVAFFVKTDDYGVYTVSGFQKKLPRDIIVIKTSTNPLRFNSIGETTGGEITLAGGKVIRIYAVTGKAELK